MGVSFDGDGNACLSDGGYIMDSALDPVNNIAYNQRQWEFSSCSLASIDTFLTTLNGYVYINHRAS